MKLIRNASGVLFLSKSHEEEVVEKYITKTELPDFYRKAVVIGNCIEPFWEKNTAQARTTIPDIDNLRILAVAKISAIKNLTTAARAMEVLRKRGINATLTVVGEVVEKAEYRKLKNYSCVQILPFMRKEELLAQYGDHDIFLLPSILETFGRVYTEAMSQGLPVLYTAGQGFDHIFHDGEVGFAIPPKEPETIANRIEDVLRNYIAISAACINGSTRFHEDSIIRQQEQFYLDALKRSHE